MVVTVAGSPIPFSTSPLGTSPRYPAPFGPPKKRPFSWGFFLSHINKNMSRSGPRPHTWVVQGQVPHEQHTAWHRQRAQAHFRGEDWQLTFEEWQQAWGAKWFQRGRGRDDYCMTRLDPSSAWHPKNIDVVTRLEHLRQHRQRQCTGFYQSMFNQED